MSQRGVLSALVLGALSFDVNASAPSAPSAPVITHWQAGDGLIYFELTANANGSPITMFTVTCNDGEIARSGTASSSPVTVAGLENGSAYFCAANVANADGTSPISERVGPIVTQWGGVGIWNQAIWDNTRWPTGDFAAFRVTASAGPNGAIAPSGPQDVLAGSDITFTLTPDSGFQIDSVTTTGCSCPFISDVQCTVFDVQADCSVTAYFELAPPTAPPPIPTILRVEGYDQEIYIYVATAPASAGSVYYRAICTDGDNVYEGASYQSPIKVSVPNEEAYTCTVTARNSIGSSASSPPTAPIVPEAAPSGLPIWLLYQAIQD